MIDLEAVLRRERLMVGLALGGVILICWAYLLAGAGMGMNAFEMTRMSQPVGIGSPDAMPARPMAMDKVGHGTAENPAGQLVKHALVMFFMWWIMMLGMMLPSAAPMLLLYAKIMAKEREKGASYVPTGYFALGYALMWAGFSAAAVAAQWGLQQGGLLSSMLVGTSQVLAAALLIGAGIWQLSPLKSACLRYCQSPIGFLSRHWRPGRDGALRLGLTHGAYCLGCCWCLMGLLFYGGVMNLYWIVGLAVYVLLEKLLPVGVWLGRVTGVGLIGWGAVLLL